MWNNFPINKSHWSNILSTAKLVFVIQSSVAAVLPVAVLMRNKGLKSPPGYFVIQDLICQIISVY